jgi:hypothetical protein
MQTAYVVTGTLWKEQIELDEELPQSGYRVRVVVEVLGPIADQPQESPLELMKEIQEQQRQRGFVPPAKEEVDARIWEIKGYTD